MEQFARVGGASIYGVNTAFALPIMTPVGTMVAVLYSTENLPRNVVWEKKCVEFCKTLQPEPRWKLVIDVGLKDPSEGRNTHVDTANYAESEKARTVSVETSHGNSAAHVSPKLSASNDSSIVPVSPLPAAKAALTSSTMFANREEPSYVWNEQSLALLLGKYMPLNSSSSTLTSLTNMAMGNSNLASDLVSLRLLLLRHSSCRSPLEVSLVDAIMKKYQAYIQARHTEYEIMNLVMNDWKYLIASQQTGHAHAEQMNVNMNSQQGQGSNVPRVVSESGPIKNGEGYC